MAEFFPVRNLRDYQHSSHLFRSGNGVPGQTGKARRFELSPHYKYLFHVFFELSGAVKIPDIETVGMLVKNVKLPAYKMDTEELNQYNRVRYVQTKIHYEPVNVTFHADSSATIRDLWKEYYNYHYHDTNKNPSGKEFQNRDIYQDSSGYNGEWGLKPNPQQFFKSVRIFGMSRGKYVEYRLMNPLIMSWEHDTYDYSEISGTMEHTMTLNYETVLYSEGDAPEAPGFAERNRYDTYAMAGSVGAGDYDEIDRTEISGTPVSSTNGAPQNRPMGGSMKQRFDQLFDEAKQEMQSVTSGFMFPK